MEVGGPHSGIDKHWIGAVVGVVVGDGALSGVANAAAILIEDVVADDGARRVANGNARCTRVLVNRVVAQQRVWRRNGP